MRSPVTATASATGRPAPVKTGPLTTMRSARRACAAAPRCQVVDVAAASATAIASRGHQHGRGRWRIDVTVGLLVELSVTAASEPEYYQTHWT